MPRSAEKEQHRLKLIESAAGYLDAGRQIEATFMEYVPGQGRLIISIRMEQTDENDGPASAGAAPPA